MPLWSYLVAVPVFGLLILAHEWGHYWAAQRAGITVTEFSLGMGPKVFGFRRGRTQWNLRLLPFGGYVRWEDEGPGSFAEATLGARTAALLGGPLANLVLTLLLLIAILVAFRGDGWNAIPVALRGVILMAAAWGKGVLGLFGGHGLEDLAGPVGIVQATAAVSAVGIEELLLFTAFLSLNVGLFNLLPVPGLDGGRLVFVGLEGLRRRPLSQEVEGWIHAGGFLMLIGLLVVTVVKDLLA